MQRQDACRKGRNEDLIVVGQVGCKYSKCKRRWTLDGKNADRKRGRTGGRQENGVAGPEGGRKGGREDRRETGNEGGRAGGIQGMRKAGQEGGRI